MEYILQCIAILMYPGTRIPLSSDTPISKAQRKKESGNCEKMAFKQVFKLCFKFKLHNRVVKLPREPFPQIKVIKSLKRN